MIIIIIIIIIIQLHLRLNTKQFMEKEFQVCQPTQLETRSLII